MRSTTFLARSCALQSATVLFVLTAVICTGPAGCDDGDSEYNDGPPEHHRPTLEITEERRDWLTWGSFGQSMWAVAHDKDRPLVAYKWDDMSVTKIGEWPIGEYPFHSGQEADRIRNRAVGEAAWIGDGKYIACSGERGIEIIQASDGSVLKRLPIPDRWYCDKIAGSRNGKYAALRLCVQDFSLPGYDWDRRANRYGLLDVEAGSIVWAELSTDLEHFSGAVRTIAPSEDGRYIAVAGWKSGVAVLDMKTRKVLWDRRSTKEPSADYLAISPAAKHVYAGGREGRLYCMEMRTGKIVSSWWATTSGKEERGLNEICAVAVSPDGKLVAAALALKGWVSVWSTSSGKRVMLCKYSGALIMSFSPDSKYLATLQPGRTEVMAMP